MQLSDAWLISTGVKYEKKELTKLFDTPGYWDGVTISSTAESGTAIVHSSEPTYALPPLPADNMPDYNLGHVIDRGIYVQAIYNQEKYRFSFGIRYDRNSMFGDVINPRTSLVYKYNKELIFKLLYGEAFQEPSPSLLWASWSGREANPNLQPEKARNLEGIVMYQKGDMTQEVSLHGARYTNVIKEEAENVGNRNIYGFEYRAKTKLPAFLDGVKKPHMYFNYTYTHSESSIYYDYTLGEWQEGTAILGDIAPYKFNIGLNLPLKEGWNANVRGNFVSERELYLRNPLRAQGEKLGAYFVLNSALSYRYKPFEFTFKINNLLDKNYFHPGGETANSGNDFTQRAVGYNNSLIPQAGRSWWFNVKWTFGK